MKEIVRTFLESPVSMELVDNNEFEKFRNKKRNIKSKKEKLLPVSFINLYERRDFEHMTQRKRNLVMKYLSKKNTLSSLFLAVNNIENVNKEELEDLSSNNELFLEAFKYRNEKNIYCDLSHKMEDLNSEEIFDFKRIKINNCNYLRNIRIKYKGNLNCKICSNDILDLFAFMDWLYKSHSCNLKNNIDILKKKLFKLIKSGKNCVCKFEEYYYVEIEKISQNKCCINC